MSLEDLAAVKVPIVFGASKHEQKITDAPSSVSIITKEDIQEHGHRTLADVLNSVRGLYVTYDRAYNFLGIRGVNRPGDFGGRTLLNINGHRVNDPIYDSSFIGYDFPLDVDLIEQVEVIRGPGSSLYGNNAFFGIINVVTRHARNVGNNGVEVSGSVGTENTHSGRITYGNTFGNGLEVMLSGSVYESTGNPTLEYPAAKATGFPGTTERNHDGQRDRNFFASLSYHGLTVEGVYGRRDKELPNGPYFAVFNDPRNALWDERAYVEARYERDLDHDWHLLARCSVDHYTYEGTYIYDYANDGKLADNRDTPRARWYSGEIQMTKLLGEKSRVTFGVEDRYDTKQLQKNYDLSPPTTYIDLTQTSQSFGIFGQGELSLGDDLTLSLGVRYDKFSTFGSTVNPRAALIHRPWASGTFKAIYGQAYRAPNAFESDYDTIDYKGNHSLKPETIRSYELVWEQAIGRTYRLTSTVFLNQVKDLITQGVNPDPSDPRQIFSNTDSVDVKGAELELEGKWTYGLRARASYAFADAVNSLTGETLNNSPKHVGTLQATVPIYSDKVFAGFELVATSARGTFQKDRLPGRITCNLNLFSHKMVKNLEVSVGIYNLFDKKYADPAAPDFAQDVQPRDGRTFRAKLSHKF